MYSIYCMDVALSMRAQRIPRVNHLQHLQTHQRGGRTQLSLALAFPKRTSDEFHVRYQAKSASLKGTTLFNAFDLLSLCINIVIFTLILP